MFSLKCYLEIKKHYCFSKTNSICVFFLLCKEGEDLSIKTSKKKHISRLICFVRVTNFIDKVFLIIIHRPLAHSDLLFIFLWKKERKKERKIEKMDIEKERDRERERERKREWV